MPAESEEGIGVTAIRSHAESGESGALPTAARIRAAVLWRSGSQIAGQFVMWSSTLLVLRLLTPADYGLFAMTGVVIAFAQLMNGFSFAASLVQAETLDDEQAGQVFGVLLALNGGIAIVQLLAAPAAAAYFHQPALTAMLRVQSLLHLTTPFIIMPQALLSRAIDFRTQGRANFCAAIAGAVTAPACALAGLGVWTLVFAPLALFATRAAMLGVLGRWWVRPRLGLRGAGRLLGYGGTVLAADILWFLQSQADVFIAGRRFDAHALGLYTEGLFLTQILVAKFVPALNEVAFPAYARMQADRAAVARGFARAVGAIMLVAMPFYLGLAAAAGPLILTVMGARWADAIPVVRLLALAMPFATLQILYAPATNALGRPGVATRVTAIGAVLLPIAFLVGVRDGPVGMALAWLVAAPLLALLASRVSLPVIGLSWRALAGATLPPAVAAMLMAGIVAEADRLLPPSIGPAPRLLLLVATGVAAYAVLAWTIARGAVEQAIAMARGKAQAPAM